jgi:Ni/Co efflux regulator RcnB
MLRSLTVSTLILGSVLAFVQPQVAAARDRDDYRYERDRYRDERRARARHERHEREEWREHQRFEQRYRDRDRDYRRGYFDRWGNWHWY